MLSSSPTHRRRQSSISIKPPKPSSTSNSRRNSQYSPSSQRSSRRFDGDEHSCATSPRHSHDFASSIGLHSGNDLGNLADELAGAWDEDEGEEDSNDTSQLDGSLLQHQSLPKTPLKYDLEKIRDSGIDVSSPPGSSASTSTSPVRKGHLSELEHTRRRSEESPIDGRSIVPVDDIPRTLHACIKEIELLAASGLGTDDTIAEYPEAQDPTSRLLISLRKLGSQRSTFETHTTRLITAHSSIAMHLANTHRTLQSFSYFFVSPLPSLMLLDEEEFDDILSVLSKTLASLPQPTVAALSGLDRLHSTSKDAIASLSNLSDSLHMTRQATATAARRLKGTKDMVSQLRDDLRKADEGVLWIESGHWDRRLANREAASSCRDILGGFEETCDGWRRRLFDGQVGEAAA